MSAHEAHGHGDNVVEDAGVGGVIIHGRTTLQQMVNAVVTQALAGRSNALDSTFPVETTGGQFRVHLHLCVKPAPRGPTN